MKKEEKEKQQEGEGQGEAGMGEDKGEDLCIILTYKGGQSPGDCMQIFSFDLL